MITFNVTMLYIYKFISQCLPIYAFYTILFIQRGQSITNIATLLALWSAFTIIFEIPSGVLSDRWNRRNMIVLSAILQGICFVIWFFSHTFFMFAIGFVFWSMAIAFSSGTEEGLIYDNLKSDGCEESFSRIYGKSQFYANVGTIFGIISAGILVNFISIDTIALISAIVCFANVIFAVQIREKNFYSEQLNQNHISFLQTLKDASSFVKDSKNILIYIIFLMFIVGHGNYLDEFDALIINDFQLNEIWVSVILSVRFIFVSLGDIFASRLQKNICSTKQIFLLNGVACTFLLMFAMIWNQYAIFIFGFSFMIMTITEILLVNALQNEIKEEGRATVMSFYSAGQNIVMICLSLVYAQLAGIFSLQQVYIIISCYGVIGGVLFYLLFKSMETHN